MYRGWMEVPSICPILTFLCKSISEWNQLRSLVYRLLGNWEGSRMWVVPGIVISSSIRIYPNLLSQVAIHVQQKAGSRIIYKLACWKGSPLSIFLSFFIHYLWSISLKMKPLLIIMYHSIQEQNMWHKKNGHFPVCLDIRSFLSLLLVLLVIFTQPIVLHSSCNELGFEWMNASLVWNWR
jgi:hypothetical protein